MIDLATVGRSVGAPISVTKKPVGHPHRLQLLTVTMRQIRHRGGTTTQFPPSPFFSVKVADLVGFYWLFAALNVELPKRLGVKPRYTSSRLSTNSNAAHRSLAFKPCRDVYHISNHRVRSTAASSKDANGGSPGIDSGTESRPVGVGACHGAGGLLDC